MPSHQGFGHMTLSVTDLDRSVEFYNRVFGAQAVLNAEDQYGPVAVCVGPNFMIGLRRHPSTAAGDAFDFSRVGVDHMGVHVADQAELEAWRAFLDEQGVENSGVVESPWGHHVNAKDPDGIAIEFFAAAPHGG